MTHPSRAFRAIPGAQVTAVPEVMQWPCPRCGVWIENRGAHLTNRAPCTECRKWLREQEGDLMLYDKREIKKAADRLRRLGFAPRIPLQVIDPDAAGVTVSVRSVHRFEWWVDISQLPEVLLNADGERIPAEVAA